ncbi:MAG: hypothetical protein M1821_007470 [Bathelium mastoideum]|nr:MAG: hypothetical protein M1821_007470 [Bathelium mastoideum]
MGVEISRPKTVSTSQVRSKRGVQKAGRPTPEIQAQRVPEISIQTTSEGIYFGPHNGGFGKFLYAPHQSEDTQRRSDEQESEGTSVVIYDLAQPEDVQGNRVNIFSKLDELRKHTENSSNHTSSRLLFLNGFVDPSWLSYIAAQYDVDPEFFHRHLDLSSTLSAGVGRYTYLPHLPASAEMFQLRIITVGEWDTSLSGLSVKALRNECQASMSDYLDRLEKRQDTTPGQSMVRRFHVYNQKFFSMEQLISVVVSRQARHWTAVIWSDSGADLNESKYGPWHDPQRKLPQTTIFHPISQHRSRIVVKGPPEHEGASASDSYSTQHNLSQSATQLSKDYGRSLEPELMSSSPLYALQEVLSFSVAAECQFLHLMELQVGSLTETGGDQSISELLLLKNIVEDHRSAFQDSFDSIKALGGIEASSPVSGLSSTNPSNRKSDKKRPSQSRPSTSSSNRKSDKTHSSESRPPTNSNNRRSDKTHSSQSQPPKIEASTTHLLGNYESTLRRLKTLSDRCSEGITMSLDQAMYREGQKSTEQAESFGKLTALAFFFATLSFTTNFFGMIIRELSQSKLSIWVWLILTVPVLGISVAVALEPEQRLEAVQNLVRNRKIPFVAQTARHLEE